MPLVKTCCIAVLTGLAVGLARVPTAVPAAAREARAATAAMVLDHNRLLVDAEVRSRDGTWRPARLWIDSGNPDFMLSAAFARSLGFDVPETAKMPSGPLSLAGVEVRISGVPLGVSDLVPAVRPGAEALWSTMHADGNIPSTALQRFRLVLDYPRRRVEFGPPGNPSSRGSAIPMRLNPDTGIVQVEALVGTDRFDLAVDIGASYSFVSSAVLATLAARHADWPRMTGAVGCANIWGLWPDEERWQVLRVPRMRLGAISIAGVGLVGLPDIFGRAGDLGAWYSRKTARPVVGFLGPNAFKAFRVEIDYRGGTIWLERHADDESHDMDLVGLTLQPDAGRWRIVGSVVEGVRPGDVLSRIGDLPTDGATMGNVVDALRGAPGDERLLVVVRDGRTIRVSARVRRLM
jgi:hypothetical protein